MIDAIPTGRAASLLDITEPQLAELVRRGHVHPPPEVVAGRRLWERDHILQAARHLGISEEIVLAKLGEVARG